MTDAVVIEIAEAVKDDLNAGSWSHVFTAARAYLPENDAGTLSTLRVSVVPSAVRKEVLTRSNERGEYRIGIIVQKKVDDKLNATLDPLMRLVEEIMDYLFMRKLDNYADAFPSTTIANDPIYDVEDLEEDLIFTAPVEVEYVVTRA